MKTINPNTLQVASVSNELRATFLGALTQEFIERKLSCEGMMRLAMATANYVMDPHLFSEGKYTNGTGYYDPLCRLIFVDENDEPIENGNTIAIRDHNTNRRLIVVVVQPGINVVIHDRYTLDLEGVATIVVSSDIPNFRESIGMDPVWSANCHYDMAMMSHFFGFEYNRAENYVYPTKERCDNSIKKGLMMSENIIRLAYGRLGEYIGEETNTGDTPT